MNHHQHQQQQPLHHLPEHDVRANGRNEGVLENNSNTQDLQEPLGDAQPKQSFTMNPFEEFLQEKEGEERGEEEHQEHQEYQEEQQQQRFSYGSGYGDGDRDESHECTPAEVVSTEQHCVSYLMMKYDFMGREEREMSAFAGEFLVALQKLDENWWLARRSQVNSLENEHENENEHGHENESSTTEKDTENRNQMGLVPASYVQEMSMDEYKELEKEVEDAFPLSMEENAQEQALANTLAKEEDLEEQEGEWFSRNEFGDSGHRHPHVEVGQAHSWQFHPAQHGEFRHSEPFDGVDTAEERMRAMNLAPQEGEREENDGEKQEKIESNQQDDNHNRDSANDSDTANHAKIKQEDSCGAIVTMNEASEKYEDDTVFARVVPSDIQDPSSSPSASASESTSASESASGSIRTSSAAAPFPSSTSSSISNQNSNLDHIPSESQTIVEKAEALFQRERMDEKNLLKIKQLCNQGNTSEALMMLEAIEVASRFEPAYYNYSAGSTSSSSNGSLPYRDSSIRKPGPLTPEDARRERELEIQRIQEEQVRRRLEIQRTRDDEKSTAKEENDQSSSAAPPTSPKDDTQSWPTSNVNDSDNKDTTNFSNNRQFHEDADAGAGADDGAHADADDGAHADAGVGAHADAGDGDGDGDQSAISSTPTGPPTAAPMGTPVAQTPHANDLENLSKQNAEKLRQHRLEEQRKMKLQQEKQEKTLKPRSSSQEQRQMDGSIAKRSAAEYANKAVAADNQRQYRTAYNNYSNALLKCASALDLEAFLVPAQVLKHMEGYIKRLFLLEPVVCTGEPESPRPFPDLAKVLSSMVRTGYGDEVLKRGQEFSLLARELEDENKPKSAKMTYKFAINHLMAVRGVQRSKGETVSEELMQKLNEMLTRAEQLGDVQ